MFKSSCLFTVSVTDLTLHPPVGFLVMRQGAPVSECKLDRMTSLVNLSWERTMERRRQRYFLLCCEPPQAAWCADPGHCLKSDSSLLRLGSSSPLTLQFLVPVYSYIFVFLTSSASSLWQSLFTVLRPCPFLHLLSYNHTPLSFHPYRASF